MTAYRSCRYWGGAGSPAPSPSTVTIPMVTPSPRTAYASLHLKFLQIRFLRPPAPPAPSLPPHLPVSLKPNRPKISSQTPALALCKAPAGVALRAFLWVWVFLLFLKFSHVEVQRGDDGDGRVVLLPSDATGDAGYLLLFLRGFPLVHPPWRRYPPMETTPCPNRAVGPARGKPCCQGLVTIRKGLCREKPPPETPLTSPVRWAGEGTSHQRGLQVIGPWRTSAFC